MKIRFEKRKIRPGYRAAIFMAAVFSAGVAQAQGPAPAVAATKPPAATPARIPAAGAISAAGAASAPASAGAVPAAGVAAAGVVAAVAGEKKKSPVPLLFFRAQADSPSIWNPAFPDFIPPNAFLAVGGRILSIRLETVPSQPGPGPEKSASGPEKPGLGTMKQVPDPKKPVSGPQSPVSASKETDQDQPAPVEARWDALGRLVRFPALFDSELSEISVGRDGQGHVISLSLEPAADGMASEEKAGGADKAGRADGAGGAERTGGKAGGKGGEEDGGSATEGIRVDFVLDTEGRAERASWEDGEGGGALRFAYASDGSGRPVVREYRYDGEGSVASAFEIRMADTAIRSVSAIDESGTVAEMLLLDFDSAGWMTCIMNGESAAEAFHDGKGRPVLVRRTEAGTAASSTTFQWNEKGELVRSSSTDVDGARIERKYAYTYDGKGNWISRSSIEYAERFGALVGTEGPRLVRTIRYR